MEYLKVVESINPKSSHHEGKYFFFFYIYMRELMLTKLTVIILTIYTYIKSFCCKPKVNTVLYVSYRASQVARVIKNPPASAGDIRDRTQV